LSKRQQWATRKKELWESFDVKKKKGTDNKLHLKSEPKSELRSELGKYLQRYTGKKLTGNSPYTSSKIFVITLLETIFILRIFPYFLPNGGSRNLNVRNNGE